MPHVSSSLIFDLSLLLLPLMFIHELLQHALHVGSKGIDKYNDTLHTIYRAGE